MGFDEFEESFFTSIIVLSHGQIVNGYCLKYS